MPKTLNSRTQTISKRKPDAGPSLGTSGPAPAPHPSFSVAEGAKQCPSPARSPDARAHPGFAGGPRRARAADPAERRPHGPGAPEPCPASSAAAAETERGPRAPRRRPAGSRKRPPRSSLLRGRTAAAALHPPPPPDQPHHPNRPRAAAAPRARLRPRGESRSQVCRGLRRRIPGARRSTAWDAQHGELCPSPGRVAQARVEEAGHPYKTQAGRLLKAGRLMEAY